LYNFAEYLTFRKECRPLAHAQMEQRTHARLANDTDDERSHNLHDEFARHVRLGGFPAIHLHAYTMDEAHTIVRDICTAFIQNPLPLVANGTPNVIQ